MSREPCAQCGAAFSGRADDQYCATCRELPCFGCGQPYALHRDELPASGARPRMPCIGLKRYYRPRKEAT